MASTSADGSVDGAAETVSSATAAATSASEMASEPGDGDLGSPALTLRTASARLRTLACNELRSSSRGLAQFFKKWALCRHRHKSHLKRDFASFLLRGPEANRLGQNLLFLRQLMFWRWNRVRDGTLSREAFREKMGDFIRPFIEYHLEQGSKLSDEKVAGMCREILKVRSALFTFMDHDGVEPTNNTAERAIRFAVLWRKLSFGSDSEAGAQFVERFLTVREMLKGQGREVYGFLFEACRAAQLGTKAPSLLSARADSEAQTEQQMGADRATSCRLRERMNHGKRSG